MRKILLTVLLITALLPVFQVQAMPPFDPAQYIYVVHLYYDGDNFVTNKDFNFQYDVIGDYYEQQELNTDKPYSGKIVSKREVVLGAFLFNPKYPGSPIGRGPLDVRAPYFANASAINIYNESGKLILTINVGETSVCDDNNICDAEFGETYLACPSECKSEVPIPAISDTPVPSTEDGGRTLLWLILGAIAAAVVITGVILSRRSRRHEPPSNIIPPSTGESSDGGSQTPNVPQP